MSDIKSYPELKHEYDKLLVEVEDLRHQGELLQQTKKQYDAIFNQAPVMIFFKDVQGRYTSVNGHFEKNFGLANDEIIGKSSTFFEHSGLTPSYLEQDQAVLRTGSIARSEDRALFSDNQVHTILSVKYPLYDGNGNIDGLAGIATDVSEQRRAQERFGGLVETLDCIVWEAEADNFNFSYVNRYAEELLGYAVDQWYQPGFWISILHPEDRTWVPAYCRDCLDKNIENYELEYRVLANDGREIWLRNLISQVDEVGLPGWLRGIMVNITAQKKIEHEIESIQARFRAMFETAPVGMLLVDGNTDKIIEMNQSYCKIVGRDPDAVLSEGWESYTHSDDFEVEKTNVTKLNDGRIGSYNLVKRYFKPDGSMVWVQQKGVMIEETLKSESPQYLIIIEDITERKVFEEQIWQQANYDFLTDLPNRNMLLDRITQLIRGSHRNSIKFAVFMIDLDGFKDINDSLGHKIGDDLLVEAGRRIKTCLRDTDTVGRLGGDEFVVILSNLEHLSGVEQVANNINSALSTMFELAESKVFVSASIGVSIFPDDADQVLVLLKNADQAMYQAKQLGRNCYQFFTQDMQEAAINRMKLISDLRLAITEKQFELYYQPIVDINSGDLHKAEALIRWAHLERGLVNPAEFIPIAEETRLIVEIGDWVFREAVDQLKKWNNLISDQFQITINVSPMQFELDFKQKWTQYMEDSGVEGRELGIEITETLFMTSDEHLNQRLMDFRKSGVQISLDDFGTGYSSLSYLKNLDIDYLKIDRSFVKNLTADSDDMALCAAIVMMAHKLGMKVIAEGIETADQRDLLHSIECDYGQGYYYSKPITAAEFELKYN